MGDACLSRSISRYQVYHATLEHFTPAVIITLPHSNYFSLVQDVGGKVIHLVERAPPPPSQSNSGPGGSLTDGGTASSSQGPSTMPPHDRNANSYVMLGTFNLPVNIMDPQQIQVCKFNVQSVFHFWIEVGDKSCLLRRMNTRSFTM